MEKRGVQRNSSLLDSYTYASDAGAHLLPHLSNKILRYIFFLALSLSLCVCLAHGSFWQCSFPSLSLCVFAFSFCFLFFSFCLLISSDINYAASYCWYRSSACRWCSLHYLVWSMSSHHRMMLMIMTNSLSRSVNSQLNGILARACARTRQNSNDEVLASESNDVFRMCI